MPATTKLWFLLLLLVCMRSQLALSSPQPRQLSLHQQQESTTTLKPLAEKDPCPASYFTCNDGFCIPMRWKCDSKPDCTDGSDEGSECAKAPKCNEGQFQCAQTLKCIPDNWLCDGEDDCGKGDLSDEKNCHDTEAPNCRDFEGECHNGVCLELSRFCDGHWDCDNDELQCDGTLSSQTTEASIT